MHYVRLDCYLNTSTFLYPDDNWKSFSENDKHINLLSARNFFNFWIISWSCDLGLLYLIAKCIGMVFWIQISLLKNCELDKISIGWFLSSSDMEKVKSLPPAESQFQISINVKFKIMPFFWSFPVALLGC